MNGQKRASAPSRGHLLRPIHPVIRNLCQPAKFSQSIGIQNLAVALRMPRGKKHRKWCDVCRDSSDLFGCATCERSYHKECVNLLAPPDGDWTCSECANATELDADEQVHAFRNDFSICVEATATAGARESVQEAAGRVGEGPKALPRRPARFPAEG